MAAVEQTMEEALNLEQDLLPCVICGRTFLPIPLAKHTRVCERNATRKRKVFDSLKQRVEGTDLAPFHQRSFFKKGESAPPKIEVKQSKWKEKHLELVNAIRAAKGGTSISMPSTLSKRSSTTLGTPTHERCPSCDRQFGPKAFDRHVEWCKDKKTTTIHKSPASVLLAKERLEARTKYKVPPLTKSKRALTREKYSPQISTFGSGRTSDVVVNMKSVSACTLDRSPSVRKSKNHLLHPKKSVDRMADGTDPVSEKIVREKLEKGIGDASAKMAQSDRNLNREVKKAVEPMKSRANTTHNNNNKHHENDNSIDYDPFVSAELQLQELLECDEFNTTATPAPPPPTVQNTPRPHTTPTSKTNTIVNKSPLRKKKPVKSADPKLKKKESRSKADIAPKRASVIDPPADFCDQLNMLNENFERIENLLNYNDDGEEFGLSKGFYEKFENCSFSLDGILNRRKYSDDLSTIDPCLINENDNLSIPDGLNTDDSSPTSTVDNNYYKLGNRYEEIDHFSENFDSKMSSIEPDGTEIKLKQSISMFDDERFFESGNIDEFVIALSESSVDSKITRKKSSDKNLSKPKKPGRASKLPKSTDKSNVSDSSSFGYASNSATDRKKNNLASLKRSMSLLDPVQKPKTLKNKQDVQNYFNEQELKSPVKTTERSPVKTTERSPVKTERSPVKTEKAPVVVTKEETPTPTKLPDDNNLFVPKAEELFSVDDEMYEEYKKYEEMYLKEKEEQLKKEERRISDGQSGLLTASEDDESHQQSVKLSGDSAYGSLNRKTPKVRARSTKLTPLDSQRNLAESPNSSSSESSPVIPVTSATKTTPKMSKFCHECGNRYPLATAKFCVECGIKRLVL